LVESYEVFHRLFSAYDSWYSRNRSVWMSECLCVRSLGISGAVLDIGVGTGAFRDCMNGYVVGVDPALNPLKLAAARGVDPVNGFGEALPFRSRSFDWATMIVTICFLSNPLAALEEARRVLRRGGYLAICFVPRDSPWGELYELRRAREESVFYRFAKLYSHREVVELGEQAGFSYVETIETLCSDPRAPQGVELPRRGFSGCGFACVKMRAL